MLGVRAHNLVCSFTKLLQLYIFKKMKMSQESCLSCRERRPDELLPGSFGVIVRSVEPFVPRTGYTRSLHLESHRLRTNLGVHNKELLDDVVDFPLDSLVARLDVTNHLEQLVAVVEVMKKRDCVTRVGQQVILNTNLYN